MIKINGKTMKISKEYASKLSQHCDKEVEIETIDNAVEIKFVPLYNYDISAYNANEVIYCNHVKAFGDISVSNDYVQFGIDYGDNEIVISFELDYNYHKCIEDEYGDIYIDAKELIDITLLLIDEVMESLEDSQLGISTFNYMCNQGLLDD